MAGFVPRGNYTATTQNISSTLFCQATKRNGRQISAGLNSTNLTSANVENDVRFLVNQPGNPAPNGYVRGGSHTQTSDGIQWSWPGSRKRSTPHSHDRSSTSCRFPQRHDLEHQRRADDFGGRAARPPFQILSRSANVQE
jgi:hypothetical protein